MRPLSKAWGRVNLSLYSVFSSRQRKTEEMPPVSAPPLYSFTPRGAAAVAYQVAAGYGSAPGAARRRPLMASSLAEVGPLRVLVVEPDARTRSLLEVGLARAG